MAVVRVTINPDNVGFCVNAMHCVRDVLFILKHVSYFVEPIDEYKGTNFAELVLQGVHQVQREAGEGCH